MKRKLLVFGLFLLGVVLTLMVLASINCDSADPTVLPREHTGHRAPYPGRHPHVVVHHADEDEDED